MLNATAITANSSVVKGWHPEGMPGFDSGTRLNFMLLH